MLYLETFAMDDARARFVILLLGNPHFLEGGQGSQDGATDPDGVLPLGRSDDLDLHGRGSQGSDLLLHTIGDTGVHGGAWWGGGVENIQCIFCFRFPFVFLDAPSHLYLRSCPSVRP